MVADGIWGGICDAIPDAICLFCNPAYNSPNSIFVFSIKNTPMKHLLLIPLFSLASLGLSSAVIDGYVYYFESEDSFHRLKFNLPDYLSMKRLTEYAVIGEDGYFRLELDLTEPLELKIWQGGRSQSLLVGPDDSLHITFDYPEWTEHGGSVLAITGTAADRQYQLMQIEDAYHTAFPELDVYDYTQASPGQIKSLLAERHQQILTFWRSWDIRDPILQEWVDHQAFFGLIPVYFKYANISRKNRESFFPSPTYFDFWEAVLQQQRINLRSFSLQRLCSAYTNYLNLSMPETLTDDLPDKHPQRLHVLIRRQTQHIIGLDVPQMMRDRLLTLQMGNNLHFNNLIPGVDTAFAKSIQTPFLRKQVLDKYIAATSAEPKLTNGSELEIPDNTPSLIDFLHTQYPGKTILIDFWGTWCGSCLTGMREKMSAVVEQFREKDLQIVFVACLSPRYQWINTINELPYPAAHINLTDEQLVTFTEEFGFKSFPQYTLIDEYGQMVFRKADFPGDGLEEQINLLLSRKD
jgi:thiol-disulfide isomerase/thioredoxin